MDKFKFGLLLVVLLLVGSGSALALDIGEIVGDVFSIGALEFLFGSGADSQFIGFMRIMLAILAFSILYMGLSLIPGMNRNTAVVVGIILSIISAVFTPASVLMAMGVTYGSLMSFIVIFGPLIGVLIILFVTPTPWWGAIIKILVLLAMMWVVGEISFWAHHLQTII